MSNGLMCNTSEGIEIEDKPDELEDAYQRFLAGDLTLENIVVTGGVDALDYDGDVADGDDLLDGYAMANMVMSGEPEGLDYFFAFDPLGLIAIDQLDLNVGQGSGHAFTAGWTFCDERNLFGQTLNVAFGCTDPSACNYDFEANVDDGSCGVECAGCTDIHAVNFDPEAIEDDGSCEFWSPGCDACQTNFDFGDEPFGFSPDPSLGQSFTDGHLGLPYTDAWHVLVPPTAAGIDSAYPPQLAVDSVIVMDDMVSGSGEYTGVVFTDMTTMEQFHAGDLGLSFVLNNQGDSPNPTTLLGGNQYCALLSGIPTRAGVYRMVVGIEAWATIAAPFSVPYTFDNFMLTIDDAGEGCTDPFACNYVNALVDDGSCLYPGDPCEDCNSATTTDILNNSCQCVGGNGFAEGCTDVNACNYDPNAVVDDGSCWQSLGGAPALLIGTWKLSPEAGAIAIGPEPGSTEWYSTPQGWQNPTSEVANIDFQTDDLWTFTPEGEFIYDNNGSTMNPFDGYIETQMTVEPTAYVLEAGAGLNGNDVFTVDNMNTEVAEICGWMGVWDSGPTYTIVELTPSRLVLHALQQDVDCTNPTFSGYFTLIFERVSELYSNCYTEGCTDAVAVNFDPLANLDDGTCDYDCPPNVQLQQADLFFSEYVEGWANNKALEIYNPTLEFIDLSDYQIERYANGAASSADNQKVTLSGTLAPQDVVVCVLDKRDPNGESFESPVWDELAEKADLWLCPDYTENNAMYFNGNDVMVLRQISTNNVLDVIGKVGEDPGESGWAGLTQNHTLIRKPFVAQGDVNAVDDFMVVDEWIAIPWSTEPTNTLDVVFDNLGLHGYCYEDMEVVEGCTDLGAVNFDPMANMDDGSCVFFAEDCTTLGQEEWLNYESGAYPVEGVYVTEGAQINESFVIHLASTFVDPISGSVLSVMSFEPTAINGLPNGVFASSTLQSMTPNDQQCISLSGVTYGPGSHQLEIVGELTISLFGAPYSLGEVTVVQTLIVLPNTEGTFGCTYSYAANFNPLATMDDGSCVIAACTDPEACNYLSFATVDDGSCTYGQQAAEGCQFDSNDDGSIGSSDLLDFLTAFGIECE